jgi:hypothetical protein
MIVPTVAAITRDAFDESWKSEFDALLQDESGLNPLWNLGKGDENEVHAYDEAADD